MHAPIAVTAVPKEVACRKSRPVKGNSYRLPYIKCLAARRSRTVIASRDDRRGESMNACVKQPQYVPDFTLALINRTSANYVCRDTGARLSKFFIATRYRRSFLAKEPKGPDPPPSRPGDAV